MTIARLHEVFLDSPLVSTDTRKIQKNSIFFALKGANFNGNSFASEALAKGARYAVVDEPEFAVTDQIVLVDDVLKTLQELATVHRNHCAAKIIALTGSNGKTTTKELIHSVLSKNYKTIATKGNLNNHIGVPLTLLTIQPETEIAVVEMGANHQKEIAFLSNLAQPDFGYITNFGKAHIEGFGSEEGVIKGKSELYDYLTSHQKSVFLNADDPIQLEKLAPYIAKYGFSQHLRQFYKIEFLGANPFVELQVEGMTIQTQLIGSYNFTNCCAAIVMGKYFNVPLVKIKEALESYKPENNRSQLITKNGHQIILDAYNANPTSMQAALENLKAMQVPSKLAILGDMFELGDTAAREHQQIADLAANMHFTRVLLVGENFYKTTTDLPKFASFEQLATFLKEHPLVPGNLLIKGSRGMALERVLDVL